MPQAPLFPTDSVRDLVPDRRSIRLATRYRSPDELIANQIKLRKPSKQQIEHLAPGMRRYGAVVTVLVDKFDQIIAGHGIVAAAKLAGLDAVPTYDLTYLTKDEARALRISINKIEMMSRFDEDVLRSELAYFSEHNFELLTFTGFSSAETDAILDAPVLKDDDALPDLGSVAVSRRGDIWVFEGGHRLGCLDALEAASYAALMAEDRATLAMCDPPYNVRVQGHVTGRAGAREFAMASGEMTKDEFIAFLRTYLEHLVRHTVDGALLLQFMDWRHMAEMLAAGDLVQLSLLNLCIWVKNNPGMGSLYRSAHELCFVWKAGNALHINRVELGRNGRNRSNVWDYPGANSFSSQDDRDGRAHVSPKNLAMVKDAILDVSRPGDIVLDSFVGSGTTLLAAHRARRRGYGLELDPLYVDLAVRRMEARTKAPARHAKTALTFAETAAERANAPRLRQRNR